MNSQDIERARSDIKDYEHHKKIKHLSTAGILSGIGVAGVGGYKRNKAIGLGGALGAFGAGFVKGHSKKKEQAALNRIKNFYDLRKLEHDVDSSKGQEKAAVAGGLFALGATALGVGLNALPTSWGIPALGASHLILPALTSAADIGSIPPIVRWQGKKTMEHARVSAKNVVHGTGALTTDEMNTLAKSISARASQLKTEAMPDGIIKSVRKFFEPLSGPKGTGGHYGEIAGKGLKIVKEVSPRYADMALNSFHGGKGLELLENTVKKDINTFKEVGSVLDSIQDEIPLMRRAINATGTNLGSTAKKVLENPRSAVHMAKRLKNTVTKSVIGSKYMLGATALAGIGAMAGNYRNKHPLAKNDLPTRIAEEDNVLPFRGNYGL